MDSTIYIVSRRYWYDGSVAVVKAFKTQEKAEKFREKEGEKERIANKGYEQLANTFEVDSIEFEDGD